MRKYFRKLPVTITLISFLIPVFNLYFQIRSPYTVDLDVFGRKVIDATIVVGVTWAVYGLVCFLTPDLECPKCGHKQIAKYLYGYHKITKALERDVEEGRIILGGVTDEKNPPKWHCNGCQNEW